MLSLVSTTPTGLLCPAGTVWTRADGTNISSSGAGCRRAHALVSSAIRGLPFYESTTSSKRQKEANCFVWGHGSAARLWSYVRAGLDAGCSIVE